MDYLDQGFSSRRAAGIAFVVLFHIAAIYALVSGLGEQMVQVLHQPLQAKIITPPRLIPPAPPPSAPKMLAPPPPFIPLPLVQIAQPPPVPVIATITHVRPVTPPPKPAPAPAPTPQPAIHTGAALESGGCAAPQYPDQAADLGEDGATVMQFLISGTGAVISSRVAISSGHGILDDAAVAAFSLCKFTPAIGSDGKPREAWADIRYIWQLPND